MEHEIRMEDPGMAVVRPVGELDASQAIGLREVLSAQLEESSVVLDMAEVPFIDSSGIGVLVAAHREAERQGNSFAVAAPTDSVRKVLALTRTDKVLDVHPDSSTAGQAMERP